ncbi:MAG: hypothetical protein MUF64_01985 [Polyangiaceae bacterium]|nr:hypothetical protein [Polyangiaceae bacterium]
MKPTKLSDFDEFDDMDSIAHARHEMAIEARKVSVRGLLASLAHPAMLESSAYDEILIDREFFEQFVVPASPAHERIVHEVIPELRRWLTLPHRGKQQRARYALIRLLGPEADVVLEGLATPVTDRGAALIGTLYALADHRSEVLPASLLEPLRKLIRPRELGKIMRKTGDTMMSSSLVLSLIWRVDSPLRTKVLLDALEVEDTRLHAARCLSVAGTRGGLPGEVLEVVRRHFAELIATIAQARKTGLPSRVAVPVAASLASLVKCDPEMARQTAEVLDLLPGPVEYEMSLFTPFVELVERSIDALPVDALEPLARQMTLPPPERLPAAAAAWVRLEPGRARELAAGFSRGGPEPEGRRWLAAAHAHVAQASRSAEIEALLPVRFLAMALAKAPLKAPAGQVVDILHTSVRTARTAIELREIVRLASALGESSIVRPLLARLAEAPFTIDQEFESLLPPLLVPELDDWIEQEMEGGNPHAERRRALGRALAQARAKRPG